MTDQNTKKKTGLKFSQLLIEVKMDAFLPDKVCFLEGNTIDKKNGL